MFEIDKPGFYLDETGHHVYVMPKTRDDLWPAWTDGLSLYFDSSGRAGGCATIGIPRLVKYIGGDSWEPPRKSDGEVLRNLCAKELGLSKWDACIEEMQQAYATIAAEFAAYLKAAKEIGKESP